jgi:ribonuclease D
VRSVTSPVEQIDELAPTPLLEPREGIPDVIADEDALATTIRAVAAGTGPVAIDAERASGYRYGQRAYLVQLRRVGAGTAIIDPIACPDLSDLGTVLADVEWVLHAAMQDLPCLAGVGMRPDTLFDTELAGRLLGFERVGLGTIVETVLGFRLEKGHSAVDWSTRPLPEPWLRYAALDVELLLDLRDALESQLRSSGKEEWAREEFAAIVDAPLPSPRPDPWRRTSGIHKTRRPRQLAVVRALWEVRDSLAQQRDTSPGRVLADAAIIEAALAMPRSRAALAALPTYGNRSARRDLDTWYAAIASAIALPESEMPQPTPPTDGPPPARSWAERNPLAADRLTSLRSSVAAIADEHTLPSENLLAPDAVRRLAWEPPDDLSPTGLATALAALGARHWQVELTAKVMSRALVRLRTRQAG